MAKKSSLPEDAYSRGKETLQPLAFRATRTLPKMVRSNALLAEIQDTHDRHGVVALELSLRLRKRCISGAGHYLVFATPKDARRFANDLCRWIKSKAAVYVEQERKGSVKHRDAFLGPLND
jgi:hypothetical protein